MSYAYEEKTVAMVNICLILYTILEMLAWTPICPKDKRLSTLDIRVSTVDIRLSKLRVNI